MAKPGLPQANFLTRTCASAQPGPPHGQPRARGNGASAGRAVGALQRRGRGLRGGRGPGQEGALGGDARACGGRDGRGRVLRASSVRGMLARGWGRLGSGRHPLSLQCRESFPEERRQLGDRWAAADSRHLCPWALWLWTGSASSSHLSGGKVPRGRAERVQPTKCPQPAWCSLGPAGVRGGGKWREGPGITRDTTGGPSGQCGNPAFPRH